jgi:hypothetical protein
MHDLANVELIYPMRGLAYSQNRPLAVVVAGAVGYEFFLHLLFVLLDVLLPIVKRIALPPLERLVQTNQQIVQYVFGKIVHLPLKLHHFACLPLFHV